MNHVKRMDIYRRESGVVLSILVEMFLLALLGILEQFLHGCLLVGF